MPPTIEEARKYVDPDLEPGSTEHEARAQEIYTAQLQHTQWRGSRTETEQRELADVPITHVPEGWDERVQEAEAKRKGESQEQPNPTSLSEGERAELENLRKQKESGWTP